jgi:nucleoside phosphorylase
MRYSDDELPDVVDSDASSTSDVDATAFSGGRGQRPIDDPDEWISAWEEELVTAYHVLKDHCQSLGLLVLDECSFHDFAHFAFAVSSRLPPLC